MRSHRLIRHILIWLFFGSLWSLQVPLLGQNDCEVDSIPLDLVDESWITGATSRQFRLGRAGMSDSIDMKISVSSQSAGSFRGFEVESPYIDGGSIASNFGSDLDLGVIFTPDSGVSQVSLVEIDVVFSHPVSCLEFDISDIDRWGSVRKDSIVILGNGDLYYPTIYVVSDTPTVQVFENTAVAKEGIAGPTGNGSAYSGSDAGTVHVDFGMDFIDSFKIYYYEASDSLNPGSRGIGLFANFSFTEAAMLPVDLLDFYVEQSDDCMPRLLWQTANEYSLDSYVVEYSYDGYNFQQVGKVKPVNKYSEVNLYEYTIQRKLNAYNFLRLSKVEHSGKKHHLATASLDGSGCQNLASINVYPNPARRDYFYIEIEAKNEQPMDIVVIDQYGKQVLKTVYKVTAGKNWFTINSKYLVPGVYHIHFNLGGEKVTRKISILG